MRRKYAIRGNWTSRHELVQVLTRAKVTVWSRSVEGDGLALAVLHEDLSALGYAVRHRIEWVWEREPGGQEYVVTYTADDDNEGDIDEVFRFLRRFGKLPVSNIRYDEIVTESELSITPEQAWSDIDRFFEEDDT